MQIASQSAQSPVADDSPAKWSSARQELILVVEDDPDVLECAIESLEDLGYCTVSACDAETALARLHSDERIDIMFSDVVMPGSMDGIELAITARRLRPHLRIVLTSGYVASRAREIPSDVPLLTKPYRQRELSRTLKAGGSG